MIAEFRFIDGFYWPKGDNAERICLILSKMKLKYDDMIVVRSNGLTPVDSSTGKEIGKVKINV